MSLICCSYPRASANNFCASSFFPAWTVAMVVGVALTVAARYVFVVGRLEPYLGPPILIYTSLGLLLTVLAWLVLYRA